MKKTKVVTIKNIKRDWHLVDVKGKILGRVAVEVAGLLMGKRKILTSPHMDSGDYVVVINANLVKVTGNKGKQKLYQYHTMHPGGFKEINFDDLLKKDSRRVIVHAIKGMLPKNKLQADRLERLKVYRDEKHDYDQYFKKMSN